MKLKCLIMDDDMEDLKRVAETVGKISRKYGLDLEITRTGDPADSRITEGVYDLYFLDIGMPEHFGFRLGRTILEKNPRSSVIFCSNYEDLVFDSFSLDTFFFIKKSELEEGADGALKKFADKVEAVFGVYRYLHGKPEEKLPLWDIIYFEVLGNELYIHMNDGRELSERKTMKALLKEVDHYGLFAEVSRNYLVNMRYITLITEKEIVAAGRKFEITKAKAKYVHRKYAGYLRGTYV